jgi:hypothetical protein
VDTRAIEIDDISTDRVSVGRLSDINTISISRDLAVLQCHTVARCAHADALILDVRGPVGRVIA